MSATGERRRAGASARVLELQAAVNLGHERARRIFDAGPGAVANAIVLEELRVHNAELVVAEEELRAQLDALAKATALAHAERGRYQALFDSAPDPFFVTDRAGVVREVNGAGLRLLAIEAKLLAGKPLSAFVHPDDLRTFRDALSTLQRGEPTQLDLRVCGRHGIATTGTFRGAYSQGQNRILWTVRTSRSVADADARGQAEAVARKSRARAEELERRDRAKDGFLAVLSHDLRSPMSAILGWAEMLRDASLDEPSRERAVAVIERNARVQLALVDELLDVTRIGSGKLQLELAPVDLGRLVADASEAMLPTAASAGVTLTTELDAGPVVVDGDARRLDQVVRNLLGNALKFTPRGGHVAVRVERAGHDARVRVRDDGRGIDAEALPHIFDWLDQGAAAAGAKAGGLGLGLYIVRQLVEHHGGRVTATSRGVGLGAELEVVLPLRFESTAPPPRSDLWEAATPRLDGVRVLLVGDDETELQHAQRCLDRRGAEVEMTRDAASALAVMDARPAHVVVSDLELPRVDGLAFVALVRGRFGRAVGAVALTTVVHAEAARRATEYGYDACLTKPVSDAQLVAAILVAEASRG